MTRRPTLWERGDVRVLDGTVGGIRMLLVPGVMYRQTTVLEPEHVQTLRDRLTAWLGDGGASAPPADPCAVRAAVQQQRALLVGRDLAGSDAVTEAAWAMRALAAVELAATERPTTTDRSET